MAMAMRGLGNGPWDKLMERFKDQKRAELSIKSNISCCQHALDLKFIDYKTIDCHYCWQSIK
ncbi:hypothetical protein DERF_011830 [Dermatophagoides farinae]|uniref:Uncharacterized protein n=1 Tax=Dermatophagoides farinae TaxID=6954 RepID=A0A922L3H1_DERFA|nr:hypothetical protein DERF_011830 [Dermatophagoides farinae]